MNESIPERPEGNAPQRSRAQQIALGNIRTNLLLEDDAKWWISVPQEDLKVMMAYVKQLEAMISLQTVENKK